MDYKEFRIKFNGCDLLTWISEQTDGEALVAPRPIAESIGLEWSRQSKKLQTDPRFSCVHMYSTGADGKQYQMLTIPVRQLTGWLYSVNANKVRQDIKESLLRYQEECHIAIHDTLTGRANRTLVERQAEEIAYLKQVIFEFMKDTNDKFGRLETAISLQSEVEASCAGKQLAARRTHLRIAH